MPQGSVIRPSLFFLFINDLAKKELNCQIKLFADDLKIYKVIRSPLDCKMLQCALNAISNWSDVWQLPIVITKYACLVLNSVEKCYHNYMLHRQCIPFVDSCVDLGINVNSKLSFAQHISNVVSKAKARCSLILKCFLTNDVNMLVKAYILYMLDHC